jgi:RNA polymerase sigma factor (sigma-70 family)
MTRAPLTTILRQVRSLAACREQAGRSDGELLRAFLDSGHGPAFEEIIRRHGAMVLGVCRRSLARLPDAEDAFQATFLLLLRRASSVRKQSSLASWLHGVARRVAADARRSARRRQHHERQAPPGHTSDPESRAALREVCLVLEEEVSRLPASCREAFVLCCLEHLSCTEVAARLSLNEPAVRNRLSRARKLLRVRLARRVVSLGAAFAAAATVAGGAGAVAPKSLLGSTLKAVAHLAFGGTLAGGPVPAAVVPLVEEGTGDEAGIVHVWAVSTGRLVHTFKGQASQVSALAFTPDGQSLRSCTVAEGIRHWSLTSGKEVSLIQRELLGHSKAVNGLAISPAGRWVCSCSHDGSIGVWEAPGGRLARVLKEKDPGDNGPATIALSPDGTRLAAAFENDWESLSVHLWDLTTGQKIALTGHRAPVTQLAFSPDGHRLASGSGDTTVLIWDVSRLGSGGPVADGKALAGLWKGLGADDPKVAYAAVCLGAAAGDAAVARLKLDLKPALVIDAEKIADLVRQLDSEAFAQREKASRALADLDPAAETALREALEEARSPEVKRRLEGVLDGQEAEHRRRGHAIEVLEMIGTPAARGLLVELAKGASGSRLTREARLALARLEQRP